MRQFIGEYIWTVISLAGSVFTSALGAKGIFGRNTKKNLEDVKETGAEELAACLSWSQPQDAAEAEVLGVQHFGSQGPNSQDRDYVSPFEGRDPRPIGYPGAPGDGRYAMLGHLAQLSGR